MAPRPKVPFALHPAARLRSNLDIAHGAEVALSPDGATLAVVHGDIYLLHSYLSRNIMQRAE